jgi:two-component system nitrate/nitrite response regulator NarL
MMSLARICVVDPNPLSLGGLVHILERSSYTVVAQCSEFQQLYWNTAAKGMLELLIVSTDSLEQSAPLIEKVRREFEIPHVVAIIDERCASGWRPSYDNLLAGCLLRNTDTDTLIKSIDLVLCGQSVLTRRLQRSLLDWRSTTALGMQALSAREFQILHGIRNGDSNKAIARRLVITEATVKVHVKAILRKLSAKNRTQAALVAARYEREAMPLYEFVNDGPSEPLQIMAPRASLSPSCPASGSV